MAASPSGLRRRPVKHRRPTTTRLRLGASVAANCHPLLEQHIIGCLDRGLIPSQVRSAIMAEIVQHNAAEITAAKASAAIEAVEPSPSGYWRQPEAREGIENEEDHYWRCGRRGSHRGA